MSPEPRASADKDRVLTASELDDSVLTLDDVGAEFSVLQRLTHLPGGVDAARNCLNGVENFGFGVGPAAQSKVTYTTHTPDGFKPSVTSFVSTFASENQAKVEIANWKASLASCRRVDAPLSRYNIRMRVTEKDLAPVRSTDERIEIVADGTLRGNAFVIPYSVRCILVRVRNQTTLITLRTSLGDADALSEALIGRATQLLLATLGHTNDSKRSPLDLHFEGASRATA